MVLFRILRFLRDCISSPFNQRDRRPPDEYDRMEKVLKGIVDQFHDGVKLEATWRMESIVNGLSHKERAYLRREYISLNVKLNDIRTYVKQLQLKEGHNLPEQVERSRQILREVTDLSRQIIRQLDAILIVKYAES